MKYRKDFVTNSSSSSFVCEVCGTTDSGWDMICFDAGMIWCEAWHEFCIDHLTDEEFEKAKSLMIPKFLSRWISSGHEKYELQIMEPMEFFKTAYQYDEYLPESCCPICTMRLINPEMGYGYLLAKAKMSKNDLSKELQGEFKDYRAFADFVRGAKK